jgi:hypothetical protein
MLARGILRAATVAAPRRGARAASSGAAALSALLRTELDAMKEAGTYKRERVITSAQAAHITTAGTGAKPVLNFCANNVRLCWPSSAKALSRGACARTRAHATAVADTTSSRSHTCAH